MVLVDVVSRWPVVVDFEWAVWWQSGENQGTVWRYDLEYCMLDNNQGTVFEEDDHLVVQRIMARRCDVREKRNPMSDWDAKFGCGDPNRIERL